MAPQSPHVQSESCGPFFAGIVPLPMSLSWTSLRISVGHTVFKSWTSLGFHLCLHSQNEISDQSVGVCSSKSLCSHQQPSPHHLLPTLLPYPGLPAFTLSKHKSASGQVSLNATFKTVLPKEFSANSSLWHSGRSNHWSAFTSCGCSS